MKALLDANVLVALLDKDHQQHCLVGQWFQRFIAQKENCWLTCAITQLACLRILSLPAYPQSFSLKQIEYTLQQAMSATNHSYIDTDIDLINQSNISKDIVN